MKIFSYTFLIFFIGFSSIAEARTSVVVPVTRPLTMDCIVSASKEYQVPLAALLGILSVEGGCVGEALSNTNGTWDMGAFQINTIHTNALILKGISPMEVLSDGFVNAHVAACLLRQEYERTNDIWLAIGSYHSRTPHRRDAYMEKVRSHIIRLQKEGMYEPSF